MGMLETLPPLNETFKRHAAAYMAGEVLFLVDGSGGMPDAFGRETKPNAIIATLDAAHEFKTRDGIRARAAFWSDERPPNEVNLQDTPEQWMRQMPAGPSLMLPALKWVEANFSPDAPLHIIVVSDGGVPDDRDEMAAAVLRLSQRKNTFADCVIAFSPSRGGVLQSFPLDDPFNLLAFDLREKFQPPRHVVNPAMLQQALQEIIMARMEPQALVAALDQAMQEGTTAPVKAMSPIRWKK